MCCASFLLYVVIVYSDASVLAANWVSLFLCKVATAEFLHLSIHVLPFSRKVKSASAKLKA